MSVKKKKSGGGGANWMDTYGDMVTLLLCFFVLLYSMSTISEEKWRAIVTSFNPFADLTATDPEGNDGPVADPADDSQGGYPTTPDVAAQREIDEAKEILLQKRSRQEHRIAEASMARALNRLRVKNMGIGR